MRVHWVVVMLLAAPLAGCVGSPPTEEPQAASLDGPLPCVHPWPCADGSEWPTDLAGPFDMLEPERVTVTSFDGVELSGALWLPDVPSGVPVPVVIESTPYAEQIGPYADDPAWLRGADRTGYILQTLVEQGYAVAIFSVRGTGQSGGCFDFWGPDEQADQAVLVEWAAQQPWSSGRVGMTGLSYMGTTPWQAAIQAPPALKTIVVSGILTHLYLAGFTPQGAALTIGGGPFALGFGGAVGMGPRVTGGMDDPASLAQHPGTEPCPSSIEALSAFQRGTMFDERDAGWVADRAMIDRFGDITAAVLYTAGYEDGDAHLFQDDTVWPNLDNAPKRFVTGHWGHRFPIDDVESAGLEDFGAYQLAWFDHWLKGLGDPADLGLGTVTYETGDGTWATSSSWPPAEATDEVMYLAEGSLHAAPTTGAETFLGTPTPMSIVLAACDETAPAGAASARVYSIDISDEVQLAGNPMALLEVTTDGPGGLLEVDLAVHRAGTAPCDPDSEDSFEIISGGAADLRFHKGNLEGEDFPAGAPTPVRVDLWSTGTTLEPGDTLIVHVGWEPALYNGRAMSGRVTLGTDGETGSHIVLPVVGGTLGGSPASMDYPARPFAGKA